MLKRIICFVFLFLFVVTYPNALRLFAVDLQRIETKPDPTVIVIFGATGDLTARKVLPAIYNLAKDGNLSDNTVVVGIGRREYTDLTFRKQMCEAIDKFSRNKVSDALWRTFEKKIFYHRVNFESDEGYESLREFLLKIDRDFGTQGNRIFYLATQPSSFSKIVEKLHHHQLIYDVKISKEKWSKVVIEKPFGHDLDSALLLQTQLTKYLDESQIYRIDHYLGKVGVQNLYTLRFENIFFEPIWNNRYIDNLQITIGEQIGIGSRARFWEETGLLRDIFQNHLLQLLSIVAMEPPQSSDPKDIHREKIKLFRAIRPFPSDELDKYIIRGQYSAGKINGVDVPGYRQEKDIPQDSIVETFVAAKMLIDNERWKGVPFYVRSGKRLADQTTEIIVTFKEDAVTHRLPNTLTIRIQPKPGVFIKMLSKTPELEVKTDTVVIGYQLDSYFGKSSPEAYEKLLFDCLLGDHSSYVDAEEQIAAWRLLTPVIDHWKTSSMSFSLYVAGTWGPEEADVLLSNDGRNWQQIAN